MAKKRGVAGSTLSVESRTVHVVSIEDDADPDPATAACGLLLSALGTTVAVDLPRLDQTDKVCVVCASA